MSILLLLLMFADPALYFVFTYYAYVNLDYHRKYIFLCNGYCFHQNISSVVNIS